MQTTRQGLLDESSLNRTCKFSQKKTEEPDSLLLLATASASMLDLPTMNCTNFRSPASYERITAAAILTVVSKLIQNLCTKPKSRDNDMRFSLFPNRKTAHKAVIIVNTMMNEKAKRDVAVVGTEIVKKRKPDEM